MKPLNECRLYTFVDTAHLHGYSPVELARLLCEGGSDIIQLRAKESSVNEVQAMAESILPVTREAGIPLVINDHPDVAKELGAEVCHLGQEDFFGVGHKHVNEVRGPRYEVQIGLSTHAPDQCQHALAAEADYVAIGPVYKTGTKPTAKPVTLDYVRWAAVNVEIPWFAIGGITLENLHDVIEAGARRICVVSAILDQPDIVAACRAFKERMAGV